MTGTLAAPLARALTAVLRDFDREPGDYLPEAERIFLAALGEHGLFIPDVTAHEPRFVTRDCQLGCKCGRVWPLDTGESYFDHLAP